MIDSGPNAASHADIKVLTDSLGYVLSQGSAFLLDADNPASFDFPAQLRGAELRHAAVARAESAALFETVGRIDPELFETDSSGYTQFGRAYLSLQSFVPDEQFIAGYVAGGRGVRASSTRRSSRRAVAVPGRRGVPVQRLDREPARRGLPVPDPGRRATRAGAGFATPTCRFTRDALRKIEAGGDPEGLRPRR